MPKVIRIFKIYFVILSILFLLASSLPEGMKAFQSSQTPFSGKTGDQFLQFTSSGHALGFAVDGMYAATGSHALHVDFVGSRLVQPLADTPAIAAGKAAPLSRVTYPDLWAGISLTYTSTANGIYTTTYTLAPGADPAKIRLHYNTPLVLNIDGSLSIAFETGVMRETAPIAWQEINGQRVPVHVAFRLIEPTISNPRSAIENQPVPVLWGSAGFQVGVYDPGYALTIDPTMLWNTFLGSTSSSTTEYAEAIAVDGSGNIYVAGNGSGNWGTPVNGSAGGSEAFAAKLNNSGVLQWNTFMGSAGYDEGYGIAVDGSGNVYVAGYSDTSWGTPKNAFAGYYDAFVAKLNTNGLHQWHTFMGSSGSDYAYGIAVDGSGNVYVTGFSSATWGTPVNTYAGGSEAFAAKLNTNGVCQWNTFMGAAGLDIARSIAVDGSGNVYVAGNSDATWGTPKNAFGGGYDAFAVRLNSSGVRQWNTFMGAAGHDEAHGVAVDGSGNVYISGYSDATWGTPVAPFAGVTDAFAAKLNSSGVRQWNTFLGAAGHDEAHGVAVDGSGNVYITGYSDATWGTPANAHAGGKDAFAAILNTSGVRQWNTFMGSTANDLAYGITADGSGDVLVAGASHATWGAPVSGYGYDWDGFVAKLASVVPAVPVTLSPVGMITQTMPAYTWNPSSAASSYALYVYPYGSGSPLISSSNLSASTVCVHFICSYEPAHTLTYGSYQFKVRARNSYGTSDFSPLKTFSVAASVHSLYLPLVIR